MPLRVPLLLALVAPAHVYHSAAARWPRPAVALRPAYTAAPRTATITLDEAGAGASYRVLGLPEEATYDEITEAFIQLSERYQDDPARMAELESAKETVLDDRLRKRMAGTLQAQYEGMLSVEDRPPEPKTPLWVYANEFRKKVIEVPTPKYALRVVSLLGGLSFATWLAPNTAGTILLINVASGMGFVYNRGTPDVARDDFGQVGEIRPLQPKPFLVTCLLTTAIWLAGYQRAKRMVAMVANPPRTLEPVLRTTCISLGLIVPSLFIKVHDLFD